MRKFQTLALSLLALLLSLSIAQAVEQEPVKNPPYKYQKYSIRYELHPESENLIHYQFQIQVLDKDYLEGVKTYPITYSTSVERMEILHAYTIKSDGSRREVPPGNFQLEVHSGQAEGQPPAFSDQSKTTVIFPELEVNDSIFVEYKITQKEQFFPGQFSMVDIFEREEPHEEAVIEVDAPLDLPLKTQVWEMNESNREESNGRRKIRWTYKNTNPTKLKTENSSIYVWGSSPTLMMSTFPNYQSIAEAYGKRAELKAAVTDRIRKLADEIGKDHKSPEDISRELYGWVSKNIAYAGNCIGVGAVVPRDLDFVLDNKMGDCKDHSTLLQALLAAKGIESSQALVNAGEVYDLPPLPLVSAVNHVITFIPSLNMYLDSTAEMQPFGTVPHILVGKPVLLVKNFKPDAKIFEAKPKEDRSQLKSKVAIRDDGGAVAEVTETFYGTAASALFQRYQEINPEKEREFNKKMLQSDDNLQKFEVIHNFKDNSAEKFTLTLSVELKKYLPGGNARAMKISAPMTPSPIALIAKSLARSSEKSGQFRCSGHVVDEEYSFTFPKKVKILAIPDPLKVNDEFVDYSSNYSQKGQTVVAKRWLHDKTLGPLCEPRVSLSYKASGEKLEDDIGAQILFN